MFRRLKALWDKMVARHNYEGPQDPEQELLDFETTIERIVKLSNKAQVTLMYRLIERLPLKVVQTLALYAKKRLERDNDSNVRPQQYHSARKIAAPKRTGAA